MPSSIKSLPKPCEVDRTGVFNPCRTGGETEAGFTRERERIGNQEMTWESESKTL